MNALHARSYVRFAVVAVAAVLAAKAQIAAPPSPATNEAPAKTGGPKIEFPAPFFNFGRVPSGKVFNHDFVFTNTGDQVLEIREIKSSCGCTTANNWTRRVEPGKSGVIPILFDSSGMEGAVRKSLAVGSNDPTQPSAILDFTAMIWKLIDAVPRTVAFTFGPDFQTNQTRIARIVTNVEEPVKISLPVWTNTSFKAELKTIREGKEFELHVSVIPPLDPGTVVVPITMNTSLREMPVVTVSAFAMVQPAIDVLPPGMMLPPTPLTEPRQFAVTLRNQSTNSITLSEPAINASGAKAELREVERGRLFSLTITFPAGFNPPPGKNVEATVKSNHPQSPMIKVQFFGQDFGAETESSGTVDGAKTGLIPAPAKAIEPVAAQK